MSSTARDYLVSRFQTDAVALRERMALLARGTKVPGPDAATSKRMAEACDEVVAMLRAIASNGHAEAELDAIMALVPLLELRAVENASNPAVRSVYAGAATRIREVRTAEATSSQADGVADDDAALDDVDPNDPELNLDDADLDENLDDDDIDDDDLLDDDEPDDPTAGR